MSWSLADRTRALAHAEREGVDLLVVGGGITGAGVLRDAASRGLRALLVERGDFASGTSSRSSKMVHGGLRYLAEGELAVVREACRERDLLVRQNPNLVQPLPFLLPAWRGGRLPLWQVRAALYAYAALANFRRSARPRMLGPDEVARFSSDLRRDGLEGAGLYTDAQVDDARLVLESLKSARSLGADAVSHAEVFEWLRGDGGRLAGARVRDRLGDRTAEVRAAAVVNAAGPAVERLRGLDRRGAPAGVRPAKGVHLVIPRRRIHLECAVVFESEDGRQLFVAPWGDVALVGTTDAFTDEVDEPVVRIEEVHYLLTAANRAFPRAGLTTNDLRAVYAGVRPLAAEADEERPSSRVSREDRITEDPSGLISVTGGKLTTFRAMGERVVARALARLPAARRAALAPSRTAEQPLRRDDFDRVALERELAGRYGLDAARAAHLVTTWGAAARELLASAPAAWREAIGGSRFSYAEIPWALRHECPASLCDVLERRVRLAVFADGQGLPELDRIARVAAECAGWDAETADAEAAAYAAAVRRRYQIVAPGMTPALAPLPRRSAA